MILVNLKNQLPGRKCCTKCGSVGPFYKGASACKACCSKASKVWALANPEKTRAYSRRHHRANKEENRQRFALWYARTPEYQKKRQRKIALRSYGLTEGGLQSPVYRTAGALSFVW